ncbi:MAG: helicase-associated domain-containing protein [Microbacterium sp.]|uniref:helicase-associated domain-containing protein n=1 Tax=Microbacterium sp. TaxID=51671 RepID=UPI001AD3862E|nr:helicase-associated domain-containing protein [Microbacterium sp.]MBN9178872.1 helicase-associated domain-containing protein [Microbacterium sp.]
MTGPSARTLAHELAARDDRSLAALLLARHVSPAAHWNDAFDAAEQLLDPTSIARALVDLTAAEADALEAATAASAAPAATATAAEPGPARDVLVARGLLDADGRVWESVADTFRATSRVAVLSPTTAPTPERTPIGENAADAASAERAFTATASLADVLHAALVAPLGRIGAGTLGAADRRRLIDTGAVEDAAAADDLVAIGQSAGLLAPEGRALLVTPAGIDWLGGSTAARWSAVAARLIAGLPAGLRTAAGGWLAAPAWPGAYPFDPAWPARADELAGLLRRWAIVDGAGEPTVWMRRAAAGDAPDAAALAALLPPEVDRVYLQNDLTAIAPGSLAPHLDLRLRSMARRESRAQASSYRFTAETLADALTAGETADSLRAFLLELSLTGLPQPLAYEIERSASRHGTLRVGQDGSGRTRVTSDDAAMLQTIAVDQALRPLGLIPDGDALITRSSADTAFWMIADARYPIVAVDADGARRPLERHRLAAPPEPEADPVEVYADLLARLRAAQSEDADAAWLGRELEQAVRTRATITVTVRLPASPDEDQGAERSFTIEATGLGGGRLRGLDRTVDVERTLPVSSIVRVGPA